jgi:hypothetical protein
MIGRTDGYIHPTDNMTRAEAVTIFFRLADDDYRADIWTQSNNFYDVAIDDWFNNAVSTMANGGLIDNGGTFRPNEDITRAEFAVLVSRFMGYGGAAAPGTRYADTAGHWAEDMINVASALGWVDGYSDGYFRPDQAITRAEVAALVNRALGRMPEIPVLLEGSIMWPDNADFTAWYFWYIQKATNAHSQDWTSLVQPTDWRRLERPYSRPR